jgi:hypothetical protein
MLLQVRDKSHNGGPDELPREKEYSQCLGVLRALRATLDEIEGGRIPLGRTQ